MGVQYMTPKAGLPLVIETPMGMIEIQWDTTRPKKRLRISLPEGISVHRGEGRAMSKLRFLARREDGALVPRYSLLAPVVDDDGRIRGVQRPDKLVMRPARKE